MNPVNPVLWGVFLRQQLSGLREVIFAVITEYCPQGLCTVSILTSSSGVGEYFLIQSLGSLSILSMFNNSYLANIVLFITFLIESL